MDFKAGCYMRQTQIKSLCNVNFASKISCIQITLETQVENFIISRA